MDSLAGRVGLFFATQGRIILYVCPLARAGRYGEFLNYPHSHDDIWEKLLRVRFKVDFDYYPRGRIVFHEPSGRYTIYHDPCCEREARMIGARYAPAQVLYALDEHYQCHKCNPAYCK